MRGTSATLLHYVVDLILLNRGKSNTVMRLSLFGVHLILIKEYKVVGPASPDSI